MFWLGVRVDWLAWAPIALGLGGSGSGWIIVTGVKGLASTDEDRSI